MLGLRSQGSPIFVRTVCSDREADEAAPSLVVQGLVSLKQSLSGFDVHTFKSKRRFSLSCPLCEDGAPLAGAPPASTLLSVSSLSSGAHSGQSPLGSLAAALPPAWAQGPPRVGAHQCRCRPALALRTRGRPLPEGLPSCPRGSLGVEPRVGPLRAWAVGSWLIPTVPAAEAFGDLAFGDIFLHLLTGNLALLADEFALEDFCSSLFDGFLLTASPRYSGCGAGRPGSPVGPRSPRSPCSAVASSSRKENVQRHALRLLLHLHHRVAPARLQALQKALEPTGQVGAAHLPVP